MQIGKFVFHFTFLFFFVKEKKAKKEIDKISTLAC